MQFQDEDIQKLAALSRITLTPHECEKFRDQLTSVLAYVEQVGTVNLDGATSISVDDSRMRVDKPTKSAATQKELLAAAPCVEEGHISVLSVK
ncbi:MAG: Asp-tRNA(Asn)/Glu-tRNA(Gln) amidotransferase subunit GatC [Patescibacteria group bacterium]|jgi:aspartyl/glutamyl-tRNA(Asn/Gln) amidotransferase C subunit